MRCLERSAWETPLFRNHYTVYIGNPDLSNGSVRNFTQERTCSNEKLQVLTGIDQAAVRVFLAAVITNCIVMPTPMRITTSTSMVGRYVPVRSNIRFMSGVPVA